MRWATTLCVGAVLSASWAGACSAEDRVDYVRQIRPILSDKCFACHGPDDGQRQGGFRLDDQESALGEADSGERPIIPGDPDGSELLRRVVHTDESMRMPPAETNKQVTAEEAALLRQWIAEGAEWREHWSFAKPERPSLPQVKQAEWVQNPVDAFVLARLEKEKLSPTKRADRVTLIRRVTFDLTGLPPTLEEVDAFLADESPDAYEQVVDRLLRSPHYGEHLARFWLDAARYGDTHGLHLDNYREMWLYRDWVVRAFNSNMPFDQFTIEQLAGDLLPECTQDQLIATGFNRCHVTTNEGGAIVEEVYVRNVVDRVVTTGTVFMGLTLECTRCHDHKYDPLTMKDFYSLFAYFNSLDGSAMDQNIKDPAPVVSVLQTDQQEQLEQLESKLAELNQRIAATVAAYDYREPEGEAEPRFVEEVWVEDEVPAGANPQGGWEFVTAPAPVYSGEKASTRTAQGLSQHFFEGAQEPLVIQEGDVFFVYVYLDSENPPQQIMLQWNDGTWEHRAYWGGNQIEWGKDGSPSRLRKGDLPEAGKWVRLEVPASEVGLAAGAKVHGWAFTQFDGTVYWDRAGVVRRNGYQSLKRWLAEQQSTGGKGLPEPVQKALAAAPQPNAEAPPTSSEPTSSEPPGDQPAGSQLTDEQQQTIRNYFVEHVCANSRPVFEPLHAERAQLQKQVKQVRDSAPTTLVFRELSEPKPAYILHRGEYDQPRDQVERAVPSVLPPFPEGAPNNRLGLAQWLTSPEHPLTARVAVNRFWLQIFGTGLVKTAEDFGSQGEVPSHPELLDYLAVDFRESGWDVKRLMKQLVMSATYQQSSQVTPELLRRDPRNRLLARGPRFRLDAEMLRDQALAVSGLLVEQFGGPSVKPPQPDGLWFAVGYSGSNTVRFKADSGPDKVHRRTLYTFMKRTAPPPQMSTFDAPSREACTVRRERTNTPLQALLLMNDPQYVEAARALAARARKLGNESSKDPVQIMYRLCTSRYPDEVEQATLSDLYRQQHEVYAAAPEAAEKLLGGNQDAELAALTVVANLILNLDEVVNKN